MTETSPVASPASPTTREPSETPTAESLVAFMVEMVATGLEIPWDMSFLPDGRIFLTERPGHVRLIENGKLDPTPVATIEDVLPLAEGGLLGIAGDPGFETNHWIYLYYTHQTANGPRNQVVRYTESDNRLHDAKVVIGGVPAATNHDGGRIRFGPDGKLYITTGDALSPALAQDKTSLAGKILRVNADGSIPPDNPFPNSPVYSYGHRNPEGLAWQPGSNQLYETEHGNVAHDEVNRILPGHNYGWPEMQGDNGAREGFTGPVIESGADATWAPAGATFVQGDTFPQWTGHLLFASLRGTTLWDLDLNDSDKPELKSIVTGTYGRLRAVSQAPDGTLYLLTNNRDGRGQPQPDDDRVLRIVPAD
ncbi:MAG TPA: PQQ-dependent sugar dehydrogenase [Thermomicrobiaceae bacterium]|nr:PQQ-dependent sugar dehydrogenase [Thermomicrobiaceae bacterium]